MPPAKTALDHIKSAASWLYRGGTTADGMMVQHAFSRAIAELRTAAAMLPGLTGEYAADLAVRCVAADYDFALAAYEDAMELYEMAGGVRNQPVRVERAA